MSESVHWRLLKPGEKLRVGDEALSDDTVEWIPIHHCLTQCIYNYDVFVPMRRKQDIPDGEK